MSVRALRFGALAAGGLALATSGACNDAAPAPHGAPVLTAIYWVSGDSTSLVYKPDGDPATLSAAPPFVDEIDLVFDRRLDGDLIEDTVTENGVTTTVPMSNPPVHINWPDMAATSPGFAINVRYNPLGRFGANTSYVFVRPVKPGVPSGGIVTLELTLERLAGPYHEPAQAMASIAVRTSALTVAVAAPSTTVARTYEPPLTFSNRMPSAPSTAMSPFVHVRGPNGIEVPYKLLGDASLSSRWYLAPAECLGGKWPADTLFAVVVDPGLADAFGGKLAAGATTSFKTGAAADAPADCGVSADAASDGTVSVDATDASDAITAGDVADGAVDAGAADVIDAGALDAAMDVSPDAASDEPDAATESS